MRHVTSSSDRLGQSDVLGIGTGYPLGVSLVSTVLWYYSEAEGAAPTLLACRQPLTRSLL